MATGLAASFQAIRRTREPKIAAAGLRNLRQRGVEANASAKFLCKPIAGGK